MNRASDYQEAIKYISSTIPYQSLNRFMGMGWGISSIFDFLILLKKALKVREHYEQRFSKFGSAIISFGYY